MQRSFGSWESPITSAFITANQIKLLELGIDKNRDEVYWVEGRPTEGISMTPERWRNLYIYQVADKLL
jgi:hypothetical protein